MGLDPKALPARLLRLVSQADRQRAGLPAYPRVENDVVFTIMPKACTRYECQISGKDRILVKRKGFMICPACGGSYGKARVEPKTQKPSKGTSYSLPVVMAWFDECGLPRPMAEFRFDPERKWRFDFAWEEWDPHAGRWTRLAVEVQGGLFSGGAHVRGAHLLREMEKLNAAAVAGWHVLFVVPDDLCTTDFAETIKAALRHP